MGTFTTRKVFLLLRAIPKTVYFNFKYFPFKQAIKFPVFISHHVILSGTKGKVIINAPIKPGLVRIGFGEPVFYSDYKLNSTWFVEESGTVIFNGSAFIGNGTKFFVLGKLTFGNNFMLTANTKFQCFTEIRFGNDVLVAWDCVFMDSDGHNVLNENGEPINNNKPIIIGDKVWVGAKASIMKGVTLGYDMIVASHSVVLKSFDLHNVIIGGFPAKVIKENISWKG